MGASYDFDIRVEMEGTAHVVAVRGEVDLDTARHFARELRGVSTDGRGPVVVDLCAVTFIDSTGVQVLLNLLRRLTRQRRRLTLACETPAVCRIFEITRLDQTFDLYRSRAEAVAALGHRGRLGV